MFREHCYHVSFKCLQHANTSYKHYHSTHEQTWATNLKVTFQAQVVNWMYKLMVKIHIHISIVKVDARIMSVWVPVIELRASLVEEHRHNYGDLQ